MTKAEIIDAVYEKVGGFSKKEAAEIVEAVFDTMKDVLAEGEKIKISGFGNFVVRAKKERIGRNPQTGAPIPISARRVDAMIRELCDVVGVTSIVVSHDLVSIESISDRIAMLYKGTVRLLGTWADFENTDDPVVRQFIRGEAEGPIEL